MAIASNGGLVTVNQTGSGTVSGALSGAGGLTLLGGGTLTLSGTNTYTGATSVNAGILRAGSTSAFGFNSAATLASGTTLDLAGFSNTLGLLGGAGTVTNSNAAAATLTTGSNNGSNTFNGVIQDGNGVLSLTKIGTGIALLNGTNTYSGVTTISNGTLQIGNASSTGTLGTGNVVNNASLVFQRDLLATATVANNISGTGTLTKLSGNSLTLSGSNTYTGATIVSGGTLTAGSTSAFGSNSAATLASGTTLDLAGFSNTLGSLAGTGTVTSSAAGSVTVSAGGNDSSTTFSGIIQNGAGTVSVRKLGTGTWTLDGTNSYTGATIVNGGTLRLGANNALASTTALSVNAITAGQTALFDTNGFNQTVSGITLSGIDGGSGAVNTTNNISTGAGTLTLIGGIVYNNTNNNLGSTISGNLNFGGSVRGITVVDSSNAASDLTISAVIANGGIQKEGSGTLTLTGANTYTGATTVNAGTLQIVNGSIANSAATVNTGATLSLNNTANGFANRRSLTNTITGAGTVSIDNSTSGINGGWVVFNSGTSGLLAGFTGNVNVNSGVLSMDNQAGLWSANANLNVASGGLFGLRAQDISIANLSGSGDIFNGFGNAKTLTVSNASANTFSGTIHGNGSSGVDGNIESGTLVLSKTGAGTLTLSGTNTYTGATLVATGTLRAGSTSAFGSNSATNLGGTGFLDLGGFSNAVGSLTGAGTVTNSGGSAATLTAGGNNTSTTFSGVIQDGASATALTKTGTGTLTLTGINTFTGGTTVNVGTLTLPTPSSTGIIRGALTINSGAIVNASTGWAFGFGNGTRVTDIVINNGTLNFTGAAGQGGFAGNTITLNGGSITGSAFDWFRSGAPLAGTLNVTADATSVGINMRNTGGSEGAVTVNVASGQTFAITGAITSGQGTNGLIKTGAGTLTLSGANTYNGATTVSAGTLQIGAGFTTGTLGTGAVTNNASLVFNRSDAVTVANVVSGTGSLTQAGSGTTTLTGANTYTGATTVNNGTLSLNGSLNVGTGAADVSVASGAVLNGSGVVTAGTLRVGGAGTVELGGNNLVGNVVSNGTIGALTLNAARDLNVAGITSTGAVRLTTTGATSDITLSQAIASSASGDAVVLASGRNFINNAGASGITLTGGGRFLIYSADWAADTRGGLAGGNLYNRTFAGNPPGSISQPGSQFIYARQPVLTVTADGATRIYGNANPALSATVTGLVNGDGAGAAYSGAAALSTGATVTSNVGSYSITASAGTLTSDLGYGFQYVNGSLSVTPRALVVTADALSRIYGDANPALTYSVGGLGLVNGDVLTGGLATVAGLTSNVGSYAITQGTLGASLNYTLAYTGSSLSVTPRALVVTADALSRIYGDANPAL
ncbi:MAG: autotransporter-associated beta strand repeat-containing protein, partial [Sphingomonas sp.]|nr:autotransporter-associated beta strand repeat-containing protein [Sphingomonas sp.]